MHQEGTNPTYRSSYGSWRSSKMYSCGSCFLWSCFSIQNLVMYFHVPKINDEKKICVRKEKCTQPGCVRALGARPPHPRNGLDTTPLPTQTDRIQAKRRSVWGRALELALQMGPQLRKPTIGKPPPRPPRDGLVRETRRLKR